MAQFDKDQTIQHVFVLMLENHSFDHLLGFSGISGTDAETGQPTTINGLTGTESNSYNGTTYTVKPEADYSMPIDPGHEFIDTLVQLTGTDTYDPETYPPINNSGFVNNYVTSKSPYEGQAPGNYGEIMKCFSPDSLPVLNTLANEFAVCDSWFSSMPGPTWPNRFFVHAASSGGLDHSPTTAEIAEWEEISGIKFESGTIFDKLNVYDNGWRLYRGDEFLNDAFPNVAALQGIHSWDAHSFKEFETDVNSGSYPWLYTFIEPSYGNILNNTYKGGTSQHPLDDITGGEQLIKQTYEAIRKSPLWDKSLLVIIWDEHGGFYDHVKPLKAVPPFDTMLNPESINQYGFDFTQYGVRVPAVVISPYIPKNTIDHRPYDHASIPATLEKLFDLTALTERDAHANNLVSLISAVLRTDTPMTLPNPAESGIPQLAPEEIATDAGADESANKGSLPGFLHVALLSDLELSPDEERPAILKTFKNIQTQQDAKDYMNLVQSKVQTAPRTQTNN